MVKPLWKYRFLLGLNLLDIREPMGKGDKILDDFLLTNDSSVARKFLNHELIEAIGGLEAQALLKADAMIYTESTTNINLTPDKSLELLSQLLHWSGIFLNGLWMVKDNAITFELGFLEVWPPEGEYRVFSNFLAQTVQKSDGGKPKVNFSRNEIKRAREIFRELLLPLAHSSNDEEVSSNLSPFAGPIISSHPAVPRLKRAFYFLGSARSNRDLGMKIAMYCSLFETLFSTDATEITHKIAHRIAIFLEQEPQKRRDLYARTKKAYGIRSKVVHGDELGKDVGKAQAISIDADEIARRVLIKISNSVTLMERFHANKSDLEDYFLKESFGDGSKPA